MFDAKRVSIAFMAILKIESNKPLHLSLKFPKGREKSGKYGMQMEYITTTDDVLYLPLIAGEQINALNPAPGEPFTLLKKLEPGNVITWEVERGPQPKPMGSSRNGNGSKPQHSEPSAIKEPIADHPITPTLTTAESRKISSQLIAAIEATRSAELFAETINFPIKFTSEDIRALAISCFITESQGRRAA